MELSAEQIVHDVDDMIQIKEGRKPSKQSSNWMSSIGHPCTRYLYYLRVEGDKRAPWPLFLLKKFRAGRAAEAKVKLNLAEAGYEVIHAQSSVAFADLELYGKHDGRIKKEGFPPAFVEIKSMTHNFFMKVRKNPQYVLTTKYLTQAIAQMNAYLVGLNEPWGFFVFADRENDCDIDLMKYNVDWDLWEQTKKKLAAVNKAVEKMEAPPHLEGDDQEDKCPNCVFNHVCLPDYISQREGIKFLDEPELVARLDRIEELKEVKKELKELEEWRKSRLRGIDGAVAGDYLIQGKQIEYDKKPQDASHVSYWKTTITKLLK